MIIRRDCPKTIGNHVIDIGCRAYRILFMRDVRDRAGNVKKRFCRRARRYRLPALTRAAFRVENAPDADTYLVDSGRRGQTILYFHGGAYWSQPLFFHYRFLRRLVDVAGGRVVFPVYPKAPLHHCEDVYRFIDPIYARVVAESGAQNVVLMGDSAGGGFALAYGMELAKRGEAVPRVAAISPWLDVTCSNDRMTRKRNPWLNVDALRVRGEIYAGALDARDPRVSPLYGDAALLRDALLIVGTMDALSPDALLFAERNPHVVLRVYQDRCHVFPLYPMGEGRKDALIRLVEWLNTPGRVGEEGRRVD